MLPEETLQQSPTPILSWEGKIKDIELNQSPVRWWLFQYNDGNTAYLEWWNNGFVVVMQESYLCKDPKTGQCEMKHKSDIPSFVHSHIGQNWSHVFKTKEEAVIAFQDHLFSE